MSEADNRHLVTFLSSVTSEAEKAQLGDWATKLLDVRDGCSSNAVKIKRAIGITYESQIIRPAVKILARELKRRGWAERSLPGRFGIIGALIGMLLFGGQGAGIAALGTAIGVPLWIVVGSGAAFGGLLVEEFCRNDKHELKHELEKRTANDFGYK